jgi:hypothetical protein
MALNEFLVKRIEDEIDETGFGEILNLIWKLWFQNKQQTKTTWFHRIVYNLPNYI